MLKEKEKKVILFYIYKRYLMFYLKGRIEGKVRERGKRGRGREKGNGALYPLASEVRGKGARTRRRKGEEKGKSGDTPLFPA